MPQPAYTLAIRDWEGSIGTMEVNTGAVTAVSLPGLLTQIGALRSATVALIRGQASKEQQTVFNTILSAAYPTDADAQRGNKWLVSFHDNTAFFDAPLNAIPNEAYLRNFHVMIPTANNSLLADNENDLDITAGVGLTFKTAFEAIARSPAGGVVVVDSITQTNVNS